MMVQSGRITEYVVLGVSDEEQDRCLTVYLSSQVKVRNLKGLVRKQLNITPEFDIEFCHESQALSSFNDQKLGKVFQVSPTDDIRGGAAPRFVTSPLKEADLNFVPQRNRLKVLYTCKANAESVRKETETAAITLPSSDDEATIGLSCMIVEKENPPSADKSSVHPYPKEPSTDMKFAGLVNSGMTCYMNSLLQTLYMTPEFRNALYAWRFEGTPTEAITSIPYQLQHLFVQLFTTKHNAVSTNCITTSFGWRSTDVIQQQDVHELCRVMFDALEKKLGTGEQSPKHPSLESDGPTTQPAHQSPTHDLINRLYQGTRSDYVRCTHCHRVSCRPDIFLDIQVPLRPFEIDAKPYGSLEEAFRAMIKPEKLEGANQYYCSRCKTKRDAERVCAFHRMPYLLSLQLMRFTFDMTTLNRIKLNDRFTFPLDRWDLSEFITPLPDPDKGSSDEESLDYATEDCTDYPEMENEEELHCGCNLRTSDATIFAEGHSAISGSRTSDDDFEMETDAGDSGVNSTTDSPYDAGFSGSPTVGSPSTEEDLVGVDGASGDNPTITAGLSSRLSLAVSNAAKQLEFEKARSCPAHDGRSDHLDTDEDDGFGTGDARSACSSTTNSSSMHNHFPHSAVDGSAPSGSTTESATAKSLGVKSSSNRSTIQRTPTKNKKPGSGSDSGCSASGDRLAMPKSSVYELFSIMVHSGFINGGHYYAYIRSFTDGHWYCFNDQHVSKATLADLEDTFGSGQSSYMSQANAYFLMYRRVDSAMNEQFMTADQFPDHIREMIHSVREEEAEADRKRELELSVCKFEVFTRSPVDHQTVQSTILVYKNQTMAEASNIAREALLPELKDLVAPNCRLIQYVSWSTSFGKSPDCAIDYKPSSVSNGDGPLVYGPDPCPSIPPPPPPPPPMPSNNPSSKTTYNQSEFVPSSTVLIEQADTTKSDPLNIVTVGDFSESKRLYPFKLWLEHRIGVPGAITYRQESVHWRTYESKGLTFHMSRVDIAANLVYSPEYVWMPLTGTVQDLARETWQLYTGQSYLFPEAKNDPDALNCPFRLQLVADHPVQSTDPNSQISFDLPDWASVLVFGGNTADCEESASTSLLSSLFKGYETDTSISYGSRTTGPITIYVDLGQGFDGISWDSNKPGLGLQCEDEEDRGDCSTPTAYQQSTVKQLPSDYAHTANGKARAKRGRWQCGPDSESGKTGVCLSDFTSDTQLCLSRLRKLCAVVENHLYRLELPVEVPTENEVNSLLLQRRLLSSVSRSPLSFTPEVECGAVEAESGDTENMATSSSRHSPVVSEPAGETAATNENNPASLSNWLLKTKDFVINQLAGGYENGATAHLSPTDSCCSVAAHYGSPRTGCRPGVGRRLRKSGSPFRRRSNSQSHIDCLKIGQTSYPSSSTIHYPRPALSSDALAAMDVDHGTSDYLIVPESWNKQSTVDLGLESGSCAAVCSETADPHNDRLCCFEECPVASQSTSNTPARSLRVRLDKRLKVEQFKNRLGEYLKLDPRYLKVNVYPNRLTSASDFSELQPTDLIRISFESCLGLDEVKLTLHVLDLTGVLSERNNEESGYVTISPVWTDCIEILSRPNWSVDQILLAAAAMIRSEHHVDIPRSRLRLRKCNPAELTPGPVLGAKEILSNFTNPHQGLMVQLLSGGHFSGGAIQSELDSTTDDRIGNGFVFVRRWHPSTLSFDPLWHEVTIPVGADRETRWNTIMHWLSDHTGLPLELLEASRWNFPGAVNPINMEQSTCIPGHGVTWTSCAAFDYILSPVPNNGQVLFFKDASEECKRLDPEELKTRQCIACSDSASPSATSVQNDFSTLWPSSLVSSAGIATTSTAPIQGPRLPPGGLPSSSSYGNMCTLTERTYEQPLRIYTAEDVHPVASSSSGSTGRPSTSLLQRRRESRTP